jgi:hypothetical protein
MENLDDPITRRCTSSVSDYSTFRGKHPHRRVSLRDIGNYFLHGSGSNEKRASVLSVVVIIVGLIIENLAGASADDVVRKMRAPRELTQEAATRIASRLKPLGKQRYDLCVPP